MKKFPDGLCLNLFNYPHYDDHLVSICWLLGFPLVVTDQAYAADLEKIYPDVELLYRSRELCTPAWMAERAEWICSSDYWPKNRFHSLFGGFEELHAKKIRYLHCPHGFSEKLFWFTHLKDQECALIYGPELIDRLRENGVELDPNRLVIGGNLRWSYYLAHKAYLDALVYRRVFSRFDTSRPTLIYA
ncbi:MAG: hypothetical protein KDK40_03360, partial [Chlamydiia bacterium]|nr:hypothetical protein [Chlamydiia bacterium]